MKECGICNEIHGHGFSTDSPCVKALKARIIDLETIAEGLALKLQAVKDGARFPESDEKVFEPWKKYLEEKHGTKK